MGRFWFFNMYDFGGTGVPQDLTPSVIDPDGNSRTFVGATPDSLITLFPDDTYVDVKLVFTGTHLLVYVGLYCIGGLPVANMGTVTNGSLQFYLTANDPTKSWTCDSIEFTGVEL